MIKAKSQILSLCFFFCAIFTGISEASILSSGSGLFVFNFIFLLFSREPLSNDLISETNYKYGFDTPNKLDILIVNNVFARGSTGKLIKSLYEEYSKKYNVGVAFGRFSNDINYQNVFKTTSELESALSNLACKIVKNQYAFNYFATFSLIKVIKRYKPRIIHLHCLNDFYINNYLLLRYLKKHHIATVFTLHAENLFIGQCGGHSYSCIEWQKNPGCLNCPLFPNSRVSNRVWTKFYNIFNGFETIAFCNVSPWLDSQMLLSPFLRSHKHHIVLNGIDAALQTRFSADEIKRKYGISNKHIVLNVSASSKNPMKGFSKYIELTNLFQNDDDFLFAYLSADKIETSVPANVLVLEPTSNLKQLSEYYTMADVSVITSRWETFSMPVAESLFCGTPVVGFKAGGPETIALPTYSSFVEWGDVKKLKDEILCMISKKNDREAIKKAAMSEYSASKMCRQYLEVYDELHFNVLHTSKQNLAEHYFIEI